MNLLTEILICFVSFLVMSTCLDIKKPNIVFIVGDDIGWNDVSLCGSDQIRTPNIDMIGYNGVILSNYYTDTQGTPSRSALFTGKYSMRTGMQGISIGAAEDRGLPISEKLLPSYLRELGYSTHLIGKWHLGKSRDHFLPTYKGFDTFYGFLDGSVDYYTYNHIESCNSTEFFGLDLFNNLSPVLNETGHLTDILTKRTIKVIKEHDTENPLYIHVSHGAAHAGGGLVNLQAAAHSATANDHIAHSARRLYAGLVTGLDKSVGQIIGALAEKDILNNTLIIFVSDNGAAPIGWTQNFGSNLPLRGTKSSPWEGAVKTPAVFWHSAIDSKTWKGLFHVSDWFPTLISAAGGIVNENIDGIDQWDAIMNNEEPPRKDAVIAVDDLNGWGAFRDGDFKLIVGNVDKGISDYYGKEMKKLRFYPPPYEKILLESQSFYIFREILFIDLDMDNAMNKRNSCSLKIKTEVDMTKFCIPSKVKGCLYNISADPEEALDLWNIYPDVVQQISLRFRLIWSEVMPRNPPMFDKRSDPALHGYIWFPWLQNEDEPPQKLTISPIYPLQLSTEELNYFVDLKLQGFREKLNIYLKSLTNTLINSISMLFT